MKAPIEVRYITRLDRKYDVTTAQVYWEPKAYVVVGYLPADAINCMSEDDADDIIKSLEVLRFIPSHERDNNLCLFLNYDDDKFGVYTGKDCRPVLQFVLVPHDPDCPNSNPDQPEMCC